MRRNILVFLILFFFSFSASAQSFRVIHGSDTLYNGDETFVYEDTTLGKVSYAFLDLHNTSMDDKAVQVRKQELSLVSGSENYFCWVQCYPPSVYETTVSLTVDAQTVIKEFEGEYLANGNLGTSRIMYTFFDDDNPGDSVAVIVNYVGTGVAIEQPSYESELSAAYPNPADDQVSFKYNLPPSVKDARVVIRNVIGKVVKEGALSGELGELTIDVSSLNDGVYFYSYILDEQTIITRRLVIQHR